MRYKYQLLYYFRLECLVPAVQLLFCMNLAWIGYSNGNAQHR